MSYIGSTPTTQSFIAGTDYFNGTGSQTAFTLSRNVVSANDIQATVNNVVQQPNDAYTVSGTTITFTSAPSAGTQNVYVRYLSTTTQSITPSQGTVSYSTWNNNLQNQTFAFKNRLINGDMSIDQRNAGASLTGNDGVYPVDRFVTIASQSSKLTVQQNQGSVTPPAGFRNYLGYTSSSAYSITSTDYFGVVQHIEGFNTADLMWGTANAQTVTLSFWVRSSLTGTFGGVFTNANGTRSYPYSYTISAANTWEQKSVTVPGDTTGTWLTTNGRGISMYFSLGMGSTYSGTAGSWSGSNFYSATGAVSVVGTSGATWQVTGVQLERGSTATSFDVLPYGTELVLCQRYFYRWDIQDMHAQTSWASVANDVSTRWVMPVTMRAKPTATVTGTFGDNSQDWSVYNNGGWRTITSFGVGTTNTNSIRMDMGFGSGINASDAVGVYCLNTDGGGGMFVSAEL